MHLKHITLHPDKFPTDELYPFNLEVLRKTESIAFPTPAMISIGYGTGTNRAVDAAHDALANSLADNSIDGAKRVLFGVKGGSGLSLIEIRNAAGIIKEAVDPEANIIFGVNVDPAMGDDARLILIATDLAVKERPASGVFRRFNTKAPA